MTTSNSGHYVISFYLTVIFCTQTLAFYMQFGFVYLDCYSGYVCMYVYFILNLQQLCTGDFLVLRQIVVGLFICCQYLYHQYFRIGFMGIRLTYLQAGSNRHYHDLKSLVMIATTFFVLAGDIFQSVVDHTHMIEISGIIDKVAGRGLISMANLVDTYCVKGSFKGRQSGLISPRSYPSI